MDRRNLRAVSLPKRSPKRRLLEVGKDLLIVFLILSAVYLAARSQLYTGLGGEGSLLEWVGGWLHTAPEPSGGDLLPGLAGETIPAVRLVVCRGAGDNGVPVRYGIQYNDEALRPVSAALNTYLTEGLVSASDPQRVTAQQWQEALCAPGIYLDLLGSVPLDYLGSEALPQSARRLVLAWTGAENVSLFFQEEGSGFYYRCATTVVWKGYLDKALQNYQGNGAVYAFEQEQDLYRALNPQTLLLPDSPQPTIYQAVCLLDLNDPAHRAGLENAMGFRGSDYQVPGEWVVREDDELRIAADGTLRYEAAESSLEVRYPVEENGGRSAAIRVSLRLAQDAVAAWCGEKTSAAHLILTEVKQEGETLTITLDYVLNGAAVLFPDGGNAACFTVEGGKVTSFEIRPRCYEATEHTTALLSERLAAAALDALGTRSGLELLLYYEDSMNAMFAQWGGF